MAAEMVAPTPPDCVLSSRMATWFRVRAWVGVRVRARVEVRVGVGVGVRVRVRIRVRLRVRLRYRGWPPCASC